jgi:hypothetical protein
VLTRQGKALDTVVLMEDVETLEILEDKIDLEEARKAIVRIENGEEEIVCPGSRSSVSWAWNESWVSTAFSCPPVSMTCSGFRAPAC